MPGATGASPTPAPVPINQAIFLKYLLDGDDNEVNKLCDMPQLSLGVVKYLDVVSFQSLPLYPDTGNWNRIY